MHIENQHMSTHHLLVARRLRTGFAIVRIEVWIRLHLKVTPEATVPLLRMMEILGGGEADLR